MQFNPSLHPPKDNSERLYVPAHVWVPELFEPNAKPDRNAVELDWSRPITTGLRSYGIDQYDFVPETVLRFWKEANRPEALPDWIHFNRPTRNDEAILLTHMGNDWLDGATAVTMFVRCRFTGVSDSNEDSLIGQLSQLQGGNANEAKRVLLRYKSDVPHLEWKVFNGTADTNHVSSYDLDTGKFHDIVCRYDGVELEMWVDGISTDTATAFTDALENASHTKVPEVMGGHACTGSAVTDAPRFDLHSWAIWDRGIENYHIYDITKRGSLACMLKPKSSPSRALNKSTVLAIPNPRFQNVAHFEPNKVPQGDVIVDWSNPHTRGLKSSYLFNKMENPDLAGRRGPMLLRGATLEETNLGTAMRTSDGNDAAIQNYTTGSQGTIAVIIKDDGNDGATHRLFGHHGDFEVRVLHTDPSYATDLGGGAGGGNTAVGSTEDGVWKMMVCHWDYNTTQKQLFLRTLSDITNTTDDGADTNTSGAETDPFGIAAAEFRIGNSVANPDTAAWHGLWLGFHEWNRLVPAGEFEAIGRDFFQLLMPKP